MLHRLASLRAATEFIVYRRALALQSQGTISPAEEEEEDDDNSPTDALDSIDLLGAASASKAMITGYWKQGFEINGVAVAGSQIILPTVSFHWDVTQPSDITADSLSLFRLLKTVPRLASLPTPANPPPSLRVDPPSPSDATQAASREVVQQAEDHRMSFELAQSLQIDLLIVGTGRQQHFLSPDVLNMCAELGISVESMSTSAAIGTFNCLNQEDRLVAVALLCNEPTSPRVDSLDPVTFSAAAFGM